MPVRKIAQRLFDHVAFLPPDLFAAITDARIERPSLVQEEAERRKRRPVPAPKGTLVLLAADHPARNVLNVLDDPLGMADRHAYLARILRVLTYSGVDGDSASSTEVYAILSSLSQIPFMIPNP